MWRRLLSSGLGVQARAGLDGAEMHLTALPSGCSQIQEDIGSALAAQRGLNPTSTPKPGAPPGCKTGRDRGA